MDDMCPCGNKARRRGLCKSCTANGVSVPRPDKRFKVDVAAVVPDLTPMEQIALDREKVKARVEVVGLRAKYAESLKTIEQLEQEREAVFALKEVDPCVIEAQHGQGTSEATVVVSASDWHLEEYIDPRIVNGLNEFNLDIAEDRVFMFFNATVRLTRLLQQDVKIDTLIMGLLGDFISGNIHEEISEVCQLPPMEAIVFAQDRLVGGIEFLLAHTKLNLRFQCHSGNHARTTKTTRFSTENGHSLEYLMYRHLAAYFRSENRVTFEIAEGPHSYASVYGKTLRFQHGHMIKYNGGVGGIYIPTNKAIAQWNKGRHADLDLFGHFHQQVDGNEFMCNGSLIGYNSFAMSIKAPFDVPKQTLLLLDKKRGKTCVWPVLFDK